VVTPPPLPEFKGDFQPNQNKVQRFRVWFGKQGDMALVSHLDLVRLFDRAVRRASIPISFTGGFHPGPRISIANALTLGMTSSGEIVDFETHTRIELKEFAEKLKAQLPSDLPIYQVEEVEVKSPAATRLLAKAEYLLTLNTDDFVSLDRWQNWLNQVKQTDEIIWEKITKSGKIVKVNLRDRLFDISINCEHIGQNNEVIINYLGSCRNDGTLLAPPQVCYMLEQVSQIPLHLIHAHRQQLFLEN
jgi:radical SAM-linked protein